MSPPPAPARPAGGTLRSLYVCYLSLRDPLVETQVVAYLEGLARRGHVIHLLTYEPAGRSRAERAQLRRRLAERGVAWHQLRYHKRPSLPATIVDTLVGTVVGAWLVRRHRLHVVHCRSHVPMAGGLLLRRLARVRLIFDVRGLMAEEYEDAGRWTRGGVPFRITKRIERAGLIAADGIVVLTERVREQLFGQDADPRVLVIPCCADLGRLGAAGAADRAAVRARLGIPAERTVMVYVGKFSGWYMEQEMVAFHRAAREVIPDLHFLILTQEDPAPVEQAFARHGADPADHTITSAAPEDVGRHLAAADFAISFIRPDPSKASSSPTKVGEYLGAGLPIVATAGVGDVDELLAEHRTGVLVDVATMSAEAFTDAARAMQQLLAEPDVADRCRRTASERLSLATVGIPAYDRLYRRLAAT